MLEILISWRNKVQAFCFYWKEFQKRGKCKEINGHYCVFCELADGFDSDIAKLQQVNDHVLKEVVGRYIARGYRVPDIITGMLDELVQNTKTSS